MINTELRLSVSDIALQKLETVSPLPKFCSESGTNETHAFSNTQESFLSYAEDKNTNVYLKRALSNIGCSRLPNYSLSELVLNRNTYEPNSCFRSKEDTFADEIEFVPSPLITNKNSPSFANPSLRPSLEDNQHLGIKWSFDVPSRDSTINEMSTASSLMMDSAPQKATESPVEKQGGENTVSPRYTAFAYHSECNMNPICEPFNSVLSTVSDYSMARSEYLVPPFDMFADMSENEVKQHKAPAIKVFNENDEGPISLKSIDCLTKRKNIKYGPKSPLKVVFNSPTSSSLANETCVENSYSMKQIHLSTPTSTEINTDKTLSPLALFVCRNCKDYGEVSSTPHPKLLISPEVDCSSSKPSLKPTSTLPPENNRNVDIQPQSHHLSELSVSTVAAKNSYSAAMSLIRLHPQELLLSLMRTREVLQSAMKSLKILYECTTSEYLTSQSFKKGTINSPKPISSFNQDIITHLVTLIEATTSATQVLAPGFIDAVSNEEESIMVDRKPIILAHPDEFKNPSSFLKVYGDPQCSPLLTNNEKFKDISNKQNTLEHPRKGKNGNWECFICRNINYPRRFRCNNNTCRALRDVHGDKLVSDYTRHVYYTYLSMYSHQQHLSKTGQGKQNLDYLFTQTLSRSNNKKNNTSVQDNTVHQYYSKQQVFHDSPTHNYALYNNLLNNQQTVQQPNAFKNKTNNLHQTQKAAVLHNELHMDTSNSKDHDLLSSKSEMIPTLRNNYNNTLSLSNYNYSSLLSNNVLQYQKPNTNNLKVNRSAKMHSKQQTVKTQQQQRPNKNWSSLELPDFNQNVISSLFANKLHNASNNAISKKTSNTNYSFNFSDSNQKCPNI